MDIAVPVITVCLMVTTLEVDDAAHSTVATQELKACAICNTKECPEPPWFKKAVDAADKLNAPVAELRKLKKELKDMRARLEARE